MLEVNSPAQGKRTTSERDRPDDRSLPSARGLHCRNVFPDERRVFPSPSEPTNNRRSRLSPRADPVTNSYTSDQQTRRRSNI